MGKKSNFENGILGITQHKKEKKRKEWNFRWYIYNQELGAALAEL